MRISRKSEYALRALVSLAREQRSWGIQELSDRENIPVKFLEQILLALRHAGLLTSKRGVGGGYTLHRAADEISVAEIIRIFDGPLAPVPCAAERPTEKCTCPEPRTCAVRLLMTRVRAELAAALERQTIADMLRLARGADTLAFEI